MQGGRADLYSERPLMEANGASGRINVSETVAGNVKTPCGLGSEPFLKQAHQFGGDVVSLGRDVALVTCLVFARARIVLQEGKSGKRRRDYYKILLMTGVTIVRQLAPLALLSMSLDKPLIVDALNRSQASTPSGAT